MSDFILIKNVRASFPHLFTAPIINGEPGKCGAALMLEPKRHSKDIEVVNSAIKALAKEKLKGHKLPSDKRCLRDGDDKGREEYEGYMVLSANNKKAPVVLDGSGTGVITDESDSKIYGGCYVNAKIRLWAQDNKFGKRVNAELVAIQFERDGDPLDGTHVSVDDAMEGFGSADDEDDDDF